MSMMGKGCHLTDERLLLEIDGELPGSDLAAVRSHLEACWECRARRREIESAIADFVRVHMQEFEGALPPVAGRARLLRAQLSQLAGPGPTSAWPWLRGPRTWQPLAALCFAALLALAAPLVRRAFDRRPVSIEVSLPDSRLTPGAATLASADAVCSLANVKNKAVSTSLQRQVFREYGISAVEPRAYEVDYLVTPALGGADDLRNLWPHSYSAVWNARVKDELEDRLRDMVCDGSLDLAQAQHEIARNWIAAYKKYFHTDQPLLER